MPAWSVGEWIGVLTLAGGLLSAGGAAVWYLSAMHSNVSAIRDYLADWRNADKDEKRTIWEKIDGHSAMLNDHGTRIVALEKTRK